MGERWTIVGLGEVLWDIFPEGPRFGGAPANFACHAAMLGAGAVMVSQVGDDELGARALDALCEHGVDTQHVPRSATHPTGTVGVELDAAGRPSFVIAEDVAWDHIPWTDDLQDLAARTDAVGFGTLAQRGETSRRTIRRFLEATGPGCLRILDVNLRQRYYGREVVLDSLGLCSALKLSDEELPVIASLCGVAGDGPEALAGLRDRFGLRLIALTRGERGAVLLAGGEPVECAGEPVRVRDTVGAGDAFTAALALGWLEGRDLEAIGRHACRVAGYVCSQPGATPPLPEGLRE